MPPTTLNSEEPQNGAFRVSRASFVPEVAPRGSCRASVAAAFGTVTRPRNTQRHCGRPVPCIAALHADETGRVRE